MYAEAFYVIPCTCYSGLINSISMAIASIQHEQWIVFTEHIIYPLTQTNKRTNTVRDQNSVCFDVIPFAKFLFYLSKHWFYRKYLTYCTLQKSLWTFCLNGNYVYICVWFISIKMHFINTVKQLQELIDSIEMFFKIYKFIQSMDVHNGECFVSLFQKLFSLFEW